MIVHSNTALGKAHFTRYNSHARAHIHTSGEHRPAATLFGPTAMALGSPSPSPIQSGGGTACITCPFTDPSRAPSPAVRSASLHLVVPVPIPSRREVSELVPYRVWPAACRSIVYLRSMGSPSLYGRRRVSSPVGRWAWFNPAVTDNRWPFSRSAPARVGVRRQSRRPDGGRGL